MNQILKEKSAIIVLVLIAIIYFSFFIKIHQWECYWYASGLEGLFEVSDIHQLFGVHVDRKLNYNLYHPNHPLLHFITYGLFQFLKDIFPEIRTIQITQWINALFGVVGIGFFYWLSKLSKMPSWIASLMMAFLGSTNLYWYYSLSTEVYIAPVALLILTTNLLILLKDRIDEGKDDKVLLVLISSSFSLAVVFHLISAPFLIVILASLFLIRFKFSHFKIARACLIIFLVGFIWAVIFYGVLFVRLINIESIDSYFSSIFVLSSMSDLNLTQGHSVIWNFFNLVGWKLNSFFHSLIRSDFISVWIYKAILMISFIFTGVSIVFRKKDFIDYLLIVWLIIYLFLFIFVIRAPFNDYWLFILVPLVALVFKVNVPFFSKRTVLIAVISMTLFQVGINFYFDIFPKTFANAKDFSLLANLDEEIGEDNFYIFLFDYENERFFNEFWYVNYFQKNKNVAILSSSQLGEILREENIKEIVKKIFPNWLNEDDLRKIIVVSSPSFVEVSDNFNEAIADKMQVHVVELASGQTGNFALKRLNKSFEASGIKIKQKLLIRNESIFYEKLAQYQPWERDKTHKVYRILIQYAEVKDINGN